MDAEITQRANAALSSVQLPVLPNGVTNVKCWTGGSFAKFMNVKFTSSPAQALDYLKRVGAKYYFEFDSSEGIHRVSATHFLDAATTQVDKPNLIELNHRTGIASKSWFKSVYKIRCGWYYDSQRGAAGFQLYYDLDTRHFYIYWYCS
jgi:hypothetical protein